MPPAKRRPAIPTEATVEIDGLPVRIAVKATARARRYSLRLPTAGGDPVLTLPIAGHFSEALAFVQRHRPWLAERLRRRPPPIPLGDGDVIPLRGRDTLIVRTAGLRGVTHLEEGDPPRLLVAGEEGHVRRRVIDFLKRQARSDLEAAVARHAARLGAKPTAVRLKDTRSRWGSCTAAGELSFSWRVILAPPAVLDYLAAHEVAHLLELNHSHHFWRLVRATCPDMDRGRAWLKAHGARLHAFGAE
ncbi:MAG: SprT family zinc-dependent metalloprotease [Ancalomicrobiaceae bacterium]|nr:SprT family zinc-dependent metalloprotease [Ancalomicrobiaceae bacterium]